MFSNVLTIVFSQCFDHCFWPLFLTKVFTNVLTIVLAIQRFLCERDTNWPTNKLAKLRRHRSPGKLRLENDWASKSVGVRKKQTCAQKSLVTSLVMVATSLVMVVTSLVMMATTMSTSMSTTMSATFTNVDHGRRLFWAKYFRTCPWWAKIKSLRLYSSGAARLSTDWRG